MVLVEISSLLNIPDAFGPENRRYCMEPETLTLVILCVANVILTIRIWKLECYTDKLKGFMDEIIKINKDFFEALVDRED